MSLGWAALLLVVSASHTFVQTKASPQPNPGELFVDFFVRLAGQSIQTSPGYFEFANMLWNSSIALVLEGLSQKCRLNASEPLVASANRTQFGLEHSANRGTEYDSIRLYAPWSTTLPILDSSSDLFQFINVSSRGAAWLPIREHWATDMWFLTDNEQIADPSLFQLRIPPGETVHVSCFSLLGFDDTTFSKSMERQGDEVGNFPAQTPGHAGPFPGWHRWTQSSRVVKVGMIWSYPVVNNQGSHSSLHVLVEPILLWQYIDLFNREITEDHNFFLYNLLDVPWDIAEPKVGPITKSVINNGFSKFEEAVQIVSPIILNLNTTLSPNNMFPLDTSHVKMAWLNMSDNTWIVLCNTTTINLTSADGNAHLSAEVSINASFFFNYAKNKATSFTDSPTWAEAAKSNCNLLGFDNQEASYFAYWSQPGDFLSSTLTQKHKFDWNHKQWQCNAQLRSETCDGCGGRFELFNFAGCFRAAPNTDSGSYPVAWSINPNSAVKVAGCDVRILPAQMPNNCAGSTPVVLQPGFGFRLSIDPCTFSITVGMSLCVLPYPGNSTAIIPDLMTTSNLCSDLIRFYFDAEPKKDMLITIPVQYPLSDVPTGKKIMAAGWYSVRENRWFPICTRRPIVPASLNQNALFQVDIPPTVLTNPDFTNGAFGCSDISGDSETASATSWAAENPALVESTRRMRCDGLGARMACFVTSMCAEWTDPCSSPGACFNLDDSEKIVSAFNNSVVVSMAANAFSHGTGLTMWKDSLSSVKNDTWSPDITTNLDQNALLLQTISPSPIKADLYEDVVVRLLFSTSPNAPIQITIDSAQPEESLLLKLAWYNRSALAWTPICNSFATVTGKVSGTLELGILNSGDLGDWSTNRVCASQPSDKACQRGGIISITPTLWGYCNACSRCTANQRKVSNCNATHDTVCCDNCNPGQRLLRNCNATADAECEYCLPGAFSTSGTMTVCSTCTAGTFSAGSGSSECEECAAGTYSTGTGVLGPCDCCPPDTYQQRMGMTECTQCPAGKFSNLTCSFDGFRDCKDCQNYELSCPPPLDQCEGNIFWFNGQKWTNYHPDHPKLTAQEFQDASYARAHAEICGKGEYSSLFLDKNYGDYTSYTSLCVPCGAGKFVSGTGLRDASACLPCPSGQYSSGLGATSCSLCRAGKYSPASGRRFVRDCMACKPGTFTSGSGSTFCSLCFAGTFSTVTESDNIADCITCSPGQFGHAQGLSFCADCAAGTYSSVKGMQTCYACERGTYSFKPSQRGGPTTCKACPAGLYALGVGASGCQALTDFGVIIETTCNNCSSGRGLFWTQCPPGTFSDVLGLGLTSCKLCPAGHHSSGSGATGCVRCAAGFYQQIIGATDCIPCNTGTAQSVTGTSSCSVCGPGSFESETGSSNCSLCDAGSYLDSSGRSTCLECAAGSFQARSGQSSCSSCSAGWYQSNVGMSACDQCGVGTYASVGNQTACEGCGPGTYQFGSSCASCGAGQYQSGISQPQCYMCDPGFYLPTAGGTTCQACVAGYYQTGTGQSKCTICSVGSYTTGTGAAAACPAIPTGARIILPPTTPPAVNEYPIDATSLLAVSLAMEVPYTLENFTTDVQISMQYSIAETLDVAYRFVQVAISTARRVGGLAVTAQVKVPTTQQTSIESKIGDAAALQTSLSTNMKNYGLAPPLSVTATTKVASISSIDRLMSKLTPELIKHSLSIALDLPVDLSSLATQSDGKVHLLARIPIAQSDFTADKQQAFKNGLLLASGVQASQINFDSILPAPTLRRAVSSTDVAASIDPSASTPPPQAPTADPSSAASGPGVNKGAIAGGAVGGVVGLAVLAACLLHRRRRSKDSDTDRRAADRSEPEPSTFVHSLENPNQVQNKIREL